MVVYGLISKGGLLKNVAFCAIKRDRLDQQLSTRKESVREIYTNRKNYLLF